jgi:hypothetical protein
MKRTPLASAFCVLLTTSWLSGPSVADPLHKFGQDGAWVHVDSGWMFPREVGGFSRVTQPYNIDGNNDAGVEYRQASGLPAAVEIYAADSAATSATLDGAKSNAANKAGESAHAQSEKPFEVKALKDASGVKITYAADGKSAGTHTNLYFLTTDQWRVKVLATTQDRDEDSDKALDAFVQALPWNTLGTNPGLH